MQKIIVLSLILSSLFSIQINAQTTEKVLYLNVTRSTGAVVSAKLSDGETTKNPVVDLKNRKVYVNDVTLSLSRVSDFRFEVKEEEVSGIKSAEVTPVDDNNIYSIDGRLIGKDSNNLSKGVYIKNGRKFIIK